MSAFEIDNILHFLLDKCFVYYIRHNIHRTTFCMSESKNIQDLHGYAGHEGLQVSYELHSEALRDLKKCNICNQVKNISCFYRHKKGRMGVCSICHNLKRKLYRQSKSTTLPKKTGFISLPEETRKSIIYSLHIKIPCTIIAKTHLHNTRSIRKKPR